MASVNRAIIVGNCGQDPEVRTTQQGTKVVTLSVATSESWKDRNSGEKKERTEWHRISIWGSQDSDGLAGIAEQYLRKGSKVYLSGKIQTRKWQAQDGSDRYSTEIVLQGFGAELVLLDSQGGGNRPPPAESPDDYGRPSGRGGSQRPQANRGQDDFGGAPGGGYGGGGFDDDSIPFAPERRLP